jgi:hypothetical protein
MSTDTNIKFDGSDNKSHDRKLSFDELSSKNTNYHNIEDMNEQSIIGSKVLPLLRKTIINAKIKLNTARHGNDNKLDNTQIKN